jgi:hypothetical protein
MFSTSTAATPPTDRPGRGGWTRAALHYLGTMDYWDPEVTDGLARDREVILFDNAGISSGAVS